MTALAAMRGAARRIGAARRRTSLGTSRLWIGAIAIVAIRMAYDLVRAVLGAGGEGRLWPVVVGWIVLVVACAAVVVVTRALGEHLPAWMLALFATALGLAIALDVVANWGAPRLAEHLTVAVSAATSLILVSTTRSDWEVVGLAVVATTATTVASVLSAGLTVPTTTDVFVFAQMLVPAVVMVATLASFRAFVRLELDRSLVQGTVAAPRLAVGMLASEQLARLDLAAEELLAEVADGRLSLPLPPEHASRAAELATELRLHLLEARKQTWLYHAVSESDWLGRAVSVIDPDSIAGLLDTGQRDGLLSAIWLLLDPRSDRAAQRTVTVRIGPAQPLPEPARVAVVPIVLTTTGVNRTRVDAAVWGELARIGQYWESVDGGSLRLDVRCVTASGPA